MGDARANGDHSTVRMPTVRDLLGSARALSRGERAHLAARFSSAPWARVMNELRLDGGSILDVGCGPGLLAHLLAFNGFPGTYLGVDPDERKVARARAWIGETTLRSFRATAVENVAERGFDQAAVLDVLYLVPRAAREGLVDEVVERLAPGGRLLALTSGGGAGWKRTLDRLQERLAVVVLGMTRGAVVEPCDGAEVASLLEEAGLVDVRVADAGEGYVHGFELVSGRRKGRTTTP